MAVNHERVIADGKAVLLGHGTLSLLNARIDELLHAPAIEAEDVIVMRPGVQFEYGHAIGEVMSGDETRRLELGQYPIHRREPDLFAQIDEPTIDVLGRQVPLAVRLEDLEDLDARQRDLESRLAQVIAFHVNPQPFG